MGAGGGRARRAVGRLIVTTDGGCAAEVGGPDALRRLLESMDGRDAFAVTMRRLPDGVPFADGDVWGAAAGAYRQAAGSAARMTVEWRTEGPSARHAVCGRAAATGAAGRVVAWGDHASRVHAEELYTAAQAPPLFARHAERGDVPEGTATRPLRP